MKPSDAFNFFILHGEQVRILFDARSAAVPTSRTTVLKLCWPWFSMQRLIRGGTFDWMISKKFSPSKRESGPGPDGFPYSVYRSAGGIDARFPFAAYQACLQGAALSTGFGVSRTVFIPKSSNVDTRERIIRSPNTLRPLTLCNCDCKVIIAAMCFVLRRFSIECIHPSQRCVTQRIMTDNIF